MQSFYPVLRALVLRPLLREKIRTALTIAGIAVGVAVIVAIQLSNQSALRAFGESIEAVSGRANYEIVSGSGTVDENTLLALQPYWSRGVRFAPVIDVEGVFEGADIPLRILAVDLLSDLQFRDYRYARVLTDRGERTSTREESSAAIARFLELFREESIVIPAPFAAEHKLSLGKAITVNVLGNRRTFIIRGILEAKGPATAFNGAIAVCDISAAQAAFGLGGRLSRIDLLVPDREAEAIVRQIAASLPEGTAIERPSRRNDRVAKMLRAFRVNLFALAGVALLVGMFLVYNTVLISILRRRRDIGISKTIGVTPGQIFWSFVGEGVVFGAVGSVLGVALGVLLARSILGLVGRTINALYVTTPPQEIVLTAPIAILGVAIGLVLSVVASLQPSLEASRVPPNLLIRAGLHQRISRRSEVLLAAVAAVAFVLAAGCARIEPLGGIAIGGYLSVLFVVAGFSLLAPTIVRVTCDVFRPALRRMFGATGLLGASTLPGSLRRTAVATAALSLAIGMMVAVALMVGSFRETVKIWVDQTLTSDLWLRPAKGFGLPHTAMFPGRISEDLQRVPFLAGIDRVRSRDVVFRDSLVHLTAGDFQVIARHADMPMIAPRSFDAAVGEALRRNGVFVSEAFALRYGTRVGSTIELPVADGTRTFPVVGIFRDYSSDRGVIVMDRALYIASFRDDAINTVVLFLRPGTDREWARRELERTFGPKYRAFTVSNTEVRAEVMKIFDQTFMITYALLAVALIVAVLGIVNTLAALILERTRELALLRITGMSRGDIRLMLTIESSLIGVASTVTGALMGYVLSWILINVVNKQSFGWTIEFHSPVKLIVLSLAVTFLASALAGLVPSRLANRIDVIGAVKE